MLPDYPVRGHRNCAERFRRLAVDHEAQIDMVVGQSDEIFRIEQRREFPGEVGGVLRADAERNEGCGIAENGMPNFRLCIVFTAALRNPMRC